MGHDEKTVDRVRKLLALSGQKDSEAEASAAAVQACRLLREGELLVMTVGMLDEHVAQAFKLAKGAPRAAKSNGFEEIEKQWAAENDPPRQAVAKRGGQCRICQGAYVKGEWVVTRSGMLAAHPACFEKEPAR